MDAIRAVLFDLDGGIVGTDESHYLAWQRLADEEGIFFDRAVNDRLRGVSLLAASRVGVGPAECLVVEDAITGLEGALSAGMRVLAVGAAASGSLASASAATLESISVAEMPKIWSRAEGCARPMLQV
jgi:beta-phosphoglucomutase-like phosphatase (HAD superfamily)